MNEREKLEINGERVTMITKKCRGCGQEFRVTSKSQQKFHSYSCEALAGGERREPQFTFGSESFIIWKDGMVETED